MNIWAFVRKTWWPLGLPYWLGPGAGARGTGCFISTVKQSSTVKHSQAQSSTVRHQRKQSAQSAQSSTLSMFSKIDTTCCIFHRQRMLAKSQFVADTLQFVADGWSSGSPGTVPPPSPPNIFFLLFHALRTAPLRRKKGEGEKTRQTSLKGIQLSTNPRRRKSGQWGNPSAHRLGHTTCCLEHVGGLARPALIDSGKQLYKHT